MASGKRTPTGLGNPSEHPLPPLPRSVPLGLLTLSPVSPVWVLLAKDLACSSAWGLSDAFSQQPSKSNAEHGPVLQRFPELEGLSPSQLLSSVTLKTLLLLSCFLPEL